MTFSGPGTSTKLPSDVVKQFFDLDKYQRVMERLDSGWSAHAPCLFGPKTESNDQERALL